MKVRVEQGASSTCICFFRVSFGVVETSFDLCLGCLVGHAGPLELCEKLMRILSLADDRACLVSLVSYSRQPAYTALFVV